jgi:membrane associated rhomboid family serine protease/cytochrome c-type biogenesis protein CcmH/NrfG
MANCIRCGRQLPPFSFKKICQWCVRHEAAQHGEDDSDARQPVMATPWVRRGESTITLTHVIFGANIAVYLAMSLAAGSPMDFPGRISVHFGANYGPYTLSGEWWRLFTYMFLHGGPMHIFFNMWCLWDLGQLCESLYGRWTYAAIYVITGIAGGLASVAWNPGVLSVGASAAIFGLAGALLASFYLGEFSLPRAAISPVLRSLVFFIGFNVLFGAGFNFFAGSSGGIDNAAHFGGLVSGMALGALIARLAPQQDAPLRRACVVGVVALGVLLAGLGVRNWRGGPMRMAKAFEELGENADPAAQYQLFLQEHPDSASAHFGLAGVYLSQQKFSQAEAEYKRVLELKPEYGAARYYLGLTYLNENRPEEAKSAFTELLAQDRTKAMGHYGLGRVLAEQQNYRAAIDEFKAAAETNPSMSNVYGEMGRSYAKLKMYDDAIASYLKEKETSGDTPQLEEALAEAYQAKGMHQQAQDARDQAEQLKSGSAR